MNRDRDLSVRLFREMLRIRMVELRIESLYHLDEMKTPIHLCIGQEAAAVGVCANLNMDDYITSTHRSHGHYLAKGGNLKAMIAELYCRDTGCAKGRGGSMHLVDVSVGNVGSSSIVGGSIPIGAGLALAIKMKKQNRVSVAFFGDGAVDEGVLYESVNFAVLKRLPVIYVYENNGFSVCSRVSARQVGDSIFHLMPSNLMYTKAVDGNSVLDVYEAARVAVKRARDGHGPAFIECKTYRMRGHAGVGSDAKLGYRTAQEIAEWEAKCPVDVFRDKLLAQGLITRQEIQKMESEINLEIDEAFQFAQASPLPSRDDLLCYLFEE